MHSSRLWIALGALGAFVWGAELWPSTCATPPTPGNPTSVPGGPILSVPVDPYMTGADEQRILDLLSRPMQISWEKTTPKQLALDLDPYVRTMVDSRALEDIGLSVDMPLSLPAASSSLPAGSNLIAILRPNDMTFTIRGSRLILTTLDDAEDPDSVTMRIYDVTPLAVHTTVDDVRHADDMELINAIQTTVDPDTWEIMGGPSGIVSNVVRDRLLLTIRAPTLKHLKIQSYLDRLNAGNATFGRSDIVRPQWQQNMPFPVGGMGGMM